jgi:hypothetical protein
MEGTVRGSGSVRYIVVPDHRRQYSISLPPVTTHRLHLFVKEAASLIGILGVIVWSWPASARKKPIFQLSWGIPTGQKPWKLFNTYSLIKFCKGAKYKRVLSV